MKRPITVIDHGAGNLRSVVRALSHVGADVRVTSDPVEVRSASAVVLPGQGAFADCMKRLASAGLDEAIVRHVEADRPYLGICLGLQVLFETGHEHGVHAGLGIFSGACVPLAPEGGIKIPHMGWNQASGDRSVLEDLDGEWFYFVHSYHVVPAEPLPLARTGYGADFVSAVRRGELFACQFHPEKSQAAGLALLARFVQ